MNTATRFQNLDKAVCTLHKINTFGKGIDLTILRAAEYTYNISAKR